MQLNFYGSTTAGMEDTGYTEITDLSKSDTLAFHDNNAALTNQTAVQNFATFATSGSNLMITLHSTGKSNGTMVLDGLGGQGLTSFAAMSAAGYQLSFS